MFLTMCYFGGRFVTEAEQRDHWMIVLGVLTFLGGPIVSASIYAYLGSLKNEPDESHVGKHRP